MTAKTGRTSRDIPQPITDLDGALEETFPASDPIACAPRRGGKEDKRADVAVDNGPIAGAGELETTDEKTTSNMKAFHHAFERRRR